MINKQEKKSIIIILPITTTPIIYLFIICDLFKTWQESDTISALQ